VKYAVAVANTETDELSLMGPYETEAYAQLVRDGFVAEMDARYDFTAVFSVWVVPMRDMSTEMNMFRSLFQLYDRTATHARAVENLEGLDV